MALAALLPRLMEPSMGSAQTPVYTTATYKNPVLAAHAKATDHSFAIDDIEVWSTDSDFELERAGGRQLGADDGGLALMLDAAGIAQNAKKPCLSQPDKQKGET